MSLWFVSDTHFGHANIIKYSRRPFADVSEMNEVFIRNWNVQVKPEDTVWHLGDFAFMKLSAFQTLLRRLNGKINVVLGNHDSVIEDNLGRLTGDPDTSFRMQQPQNALLASVQHYKEIRYDGKFIVLFHYGQRVWNKSHRGSIMLYGHSHGSLPPHGRSVDVGVDCQEITTEYRPIHIDEVLAYMAKREPEMVDHHGRRGEL